MHPATLCHLPSQRISKDLSLIPFFSFQKLTCQPLTILFHTVQYILKFPPSLFFCMKLAMYICLGFFSSGLGFHPVLINRHLCLNTGQIFLINHTFLLHCRHFTNLLLKHWRWSGNNSYAVRKIIKILLWKDWHGNKISVQSVKTEEIRIFFLGGGWIFF